MPFKAPWRQYVAGDFFYGFSGARAKLIAQLTNGKTTMDFAKGKEVAWLDQLLTATAVSSEPDINKKFATFCRGNDKYKTVVNAGDDLEVPATDDDVANNARWRRKSKAGLDFLTMSKKFIHFAIDHGMKPDDVTKKVGAAELTDVPFATAGQGKMQFKISNDDKMRIITYAELRFIYRDRTNKDFQTYIQFWYQDSSGKFAADAPPWDLNPAVWANYKPSNP